MCSRLADFTKALACDDSMDASQSVYDIVQH